MSIQEEYERSVGGGRRRGLSVVGWLAVVVGGFSLLAFSAAIAASIYISRRVDDVRGTIERGAEVTRTTRTARRSVALDDGRSIDRALVRLESRLKDLGEESALRALQNLPIEDVDLESLLDGEISFRSDDRTFRLSMKGGEDGGTLRLVSDEGEVLSLAVRSDDDRGTIVLRGSDGELLRVEGHGDDDGGTLVLHSGDHEIASLEITQDDAGKGHIVLNRDGRRLEFHGPGDAGDVPGWVPRFDGLESPERVYTASADGDPMAGALRFETDASPEAVFASLEDQLRREGYEVKEQNLSFGGSLFEAAIVGVDEDSGRTVAAVVVRDDSHTAVLVTWMSDR